MLIFDTFPKNGALGRATTPTQNFEMTSLSFRGRCPCSSWNGYVATSVHTVDLRSVVDCSRVRYGSICIALKVTKEPSEGLISLGCSLHHTRSNDATHYGQTCVYDISSTASSDHQILSACHENMWAKLLGQWNKICVLSTSSNSMLAGFSIPEGKSGSLVYCQLSAKKLLPGWQNFLKNCSVWMPLSSLWCLV